MKKLLFVLILGMLTWGRAATAAIADPSLLPFGTVQADTHAFDSSYRFWNSSLIFLNSRFLSQDTLPPGPYPNGHYRQSIVLLPQKTRPWMQEWEGDWQYQPYSWMQLDGAVTYRQPVGQDFSDSLRQMRLTLCVLPSGQFAVGSTYVYDFNPILPSRLRFADLAAVARLPYGIQLTGALEETLRSEAGTAITLVRWNGGLAKSFNTLSFSAQVGRERYSGQAGPIQNRLQSRLSAAYTASSQITLTGSWDWAEVTDETGPQPASFSEHAVDFGFTFLHSRGKLQYDVEYQNHHTHDHLTHHLVWMDHFGKLHFTYVKELRHDQAFSLIQYRKEAVDLEWIDDPLPIRPRGELHYQKKAEDGQFWEAYQAAAGLLYRFSNRQTFTAEIGYLALVNSASPAETFHGPILKLGTEYRF